MLLFWTAKIITKIAIILLFWSTLKKTKNCPFSLEKIKIDFSQKNIEGTNGMVQIFRIGKFRPPVEYPPMEIKYDILNKAKRL